MRLRALREKGSVHPVLLPGGVVAYVVTRYADARQVLVDPRLVKNARSLAGRVPAPRRFPEDYSVHVGRHVLNHDGPDHRRLRGLQSAWLSREGVDRVRPTIERIVDRFVAQLAEGRRIDMMPALAKMVPLHVVGAVAGVPEKSLPRIAELIEVIVGDGDPEGAGIQGAHAELNALWLRLIREKRQHPDGDLLTALARAREQDAAVSLVELTSMVTTFFVAGTVSTAMLLAQGAVALAEDAAVGAALRRGGACAGRAVEELLRYHAPFPFSSARFAREPLEISGLAVPEGATVLVTLASANRDPEAYDRPDELRLERVSPRPHLAFGRGAHYCLGAMLARVEARIALTALAREFPDARLTKPLTELNWRRSLAFELTELPMLLRRCPGS